MRHDEHAHVAFLLKVAQQVEHFGLNRDVQSRRGLVRDEQPGLGRHRTGDEDSLSHTPRDLVRVGLEDPVGVADPHAIEHREGELARLILRHPGLRADPVDQLRSHGEGGVEVGHRLLRNVGHLRTADLEQFLLRHAEEFHPVESDRTARDDRLFGQEAERREDRLGLPGSGLTDHAHDLAVVDFERDALDHGREVALDVVGDLQALDHQQRFVGRLLGRGVRDRGDLTGVGLAARTLRVDLQAERLLDCRGSEQALDLQAPRPLAGLDVGALERVAKTDREEREGARHESQRCGGPEELDPRDVEVAERLGHHSAPGGHAGLAESEELQTRLDADADAGQ